MAVPEETSQHPISRYLNVRSAYFPSTAAGGRRIAFLTNITGVPEVWQVAVSCRPAEPPWPEQLTFEGDRVLGVWCSPAEQRLIYERDVGGDENAQLFLLDLETGIEVPLTAGHEGTQHGFGAWSHDGSSILFAANRRDPAIFDLYLQPLDGEPHLVWQNGVPGHLTNISFSPDRRRAIVTRATSSFHHDLIEIDLETGVPRVLSLAGDPTRYGAVAYSPDGRVLYINTDLASDFLGILLLDLDDLSTRTLVSPDKDIEYMTLSPTGHCLAYAVNVEGTSELYVFNLSTGDTRLAPGLRQAPGVVAELDECLSFSPDGRTLAFSYTSAAWTSDIFLWNLESDEVWPVTRSSHGGIAPDSFVAPSLVHYPTFDTVGGQQRQIPAWFFKPSDPAGAPWPVILLIHGGPEYQFKPYFHFLVQFLVQHGYAVLAPNVRGSTGYGKAYSHLDDIEKRMDSVADLAHAAYWLKGQPDVDGERLVLYGGSYGGFMVLSALCTYPDLWAAAVDIVGISSFVTFLENTSGYRRAHREAEYGSLEHDRAFLERISPLNHVDRITAPLLIIHGANDPRVPLGEAEQLAQALRAQNVPVGFLVFDDEGHGIAKLNNKRIAYPAIVDFLDEHLARPAGV